MTAHRITDVLYQPSDYQHNHGSEWLPAHGVGDALQLVRNRVIDHIMHGGILFFLQVILGCLYFLSRLCMSLAVGMLCSWLFLNRLVMRGRVRP